MYRCYGQPLSKLREQFHVIVLTASEDKEPGTWNWCDQLETFSVASYALNMLVDRIQKMAPDVILYPSLGLKMWTLLLSRIRLAPLQIVLPGHPDYPYSDKIDIFLGGNSLISHENERVMKMSNTPGSLFFPENTRILSVKTQEIGSHPIRIAVCANIFKLTPVFLQTCQKIEKDSRKKIEWHFFQNLRGIHYQLGKKQLLAALGSNVNVYPHSKRQKYMETLASCDLYLSPFPFGGENSTLDAILSGLPVVALKGKEPFERLDYRVLKTINLDKTSCVGTVDDYMSKSLEWIENDEAFINFQGEKSSHDESEKVSARRNTRMVYRHVQ
jgi:hypothetical protein